MKCHQELSQGCLDSHAKILSLAFVMIFVMFITPKYAVSCLRAMGSNCMKYPYQLQPLNLYGIHHHYSFEF